MTAARSLSAITRQTQGKVNALEKEIVRIQNEARRSEDKLEQQLAKAKQKVGVASRETLKIKQELSSQASHHRLDREAWSVNWKTQQQKHKTRGRPTPT